MKFTPKKVKAAIARNIGTMAKDLLREKMIAQATRRFVIIADDGSAFSRRKVFGVLETEAAEIAEWSHFLVAIRCKPGLAGVLDDLQVVFFGDGVDPVHVCNAAENMNRLAMSMMPMIACRNTSAVPRVPRASR